MLSTALTIACAAVLLRMLPLGDKVPLPMQPTTVYAASDGDLNRDGKIDVEDLQLFSIKRFGVGWHVIDWCLWVEDQDDKSKASDELIDFIIDYLECYAPPPPPPPEPNEPPVLPEDPLAVKHQNEYPSRLTWGPDGRLYVCDHKVGSIFIYEAADTVDPNEPAIITAVAEIKDINKPLGIAIGPDGNIYVGSDGNDNIEVYDSNGELLYTFGDDVIQMPNSIALDAAGNVYVVDSLSNTVIVFDPNGNRLRLISDGKLHFPTTITIADVDDGLGNITTELYIADQKNFMIKVFDLEGNYLRSIGRKLIFGGADGKFIRLQSIAMDNLGRLHVADCYLNNIQIFNPVTRAHIVSYGEEGFDTGQLRVPLDIAFDSNGRLAVANYGNKRVEIILVP